MIKEILAVLMLLSIAGLASASCDHVNCVNVVTNPIYESSDVTVEWNYAPSQLDVKLTLQDKLDSTPPYIQIVRNDIGTHYYTFNNNEILQYLIPGNQIAIRVSKIGVAGSIRSPYYDVIEDLPPEPPIEPPVESPIEVPLPPPPPPRPFAGYSFGTSDCNRMAILMGQEPNAHASYMMEVISWDYKYNTTEMISYCERCGANMTSITDGYYTWEP